MNQKIKLLDYWRFYEFESFGMLGDKLKIISPKKIADKLVEALKTTLSQY